MGAVVENGTLFHLKKFAKFLINLKIIKIIIIKNKKYKNLKKIKGWPATPLGNAGHPIIGQGGGRTPLAHGRDRDLWDYKPGHSPLQNLFIQLLTG